VAAAYDYLEIELDAIPQSRVDPVKILVFDFGGGTLDFCLMHVLENSPRILATDGLSIGGDLFNELIMAEVVSPYFGTGLTFGEKNLPMPTYLKGALSRWYEVQGLKSPELRSFLDGLLVQVDKPQLIKNLITLIDYDLGFELFEAIEKAKVELTDSDGSTISFHQKDINLEIPIKREEFEKIITPQVSEIEKTISKLLNKARTKATEVNAVVCTGGTSFTPLVQQKLRRIFPAGKIVFHNVFQGIAAGLARVRQL